MRTLKNDDLISRSALLEKECCGRISGNDVRNAPVVDAVEVVRCKDCRYWRKEVTTTEHWVCTQHSNEKRTFYTLPTFFCADGLRRDG